MRYELDADNGGFFYLTDAAVAESDEDGDDGNSIPTLKMHRGDITIGTVRQEGEVPVVLQVDEAEPNEPFERWDKVYAASIALLSGTVLLGGGSPVELTVPSGSYRALVYYGDLAPVFDGYYASDEQYLIVLWPGEQLKRPTRLKPTGRAKKQGLGQLIIPTAALITDLGSGRREVRCHAAYLLGWRADASAFAALQQALNDPDIFVQRAALSALRGYGEAARSLVVAQLGNDDYGLRVRAGYLLGQLGGEEAIDQLTMLAASDEDMMVRMAALEALTGLAAQLRQSQGSEAAASLNRLQRWAAEAASAPGIADVYDQQTFIRQVQSFAGKVSLWQQQLTK